VIWKQIPLSLVRALGFFGLLLAGVALFAVVTGPVVLAALGLGRLIDLLLIAHRGPGGGGDVSRDMLATVAGLICCRFVLPVALLAIRRLAMLTRRLMERWCGVPIASAYRPRPVGPGRLGYQRRMSWLLGDPGTWRDLLWLVVNATAGLVLLLLPAVLTGLGVVVFLQPLLSDRPHVMFAIGLAFVAAGLGTAPLLLRGYADLARLVLAPSEEAKLELRVRHLAQTRRETLDTGAAELRPVVQVAMGLTLDAAGRLIDTDPAAARALLIEARDASARALAELRDLVRGIHPPVLADRGLADAVRALALDSPLRARVTGSLDGRPPAPVESAAYFAVSELLANVAKHAGANGAEVDLRHSSGSLRISVSDDGDGGADPSRGTGLAGVGRRLAAFDGVLVVSSPAGGPTLVTMEVPCALS